MSDYAAVREQPQALTWGCRGVVMDAVGRYGRSQPGFCSSAGPSRAFVPPQGQPGFVPQVVHIDDPQRAELRLKQGLPPTDFV